jgi:hypothetical protein
LVLSDPSPDTRQLFELIEQARARNLQDQLKGNAGPAATLQSVQARLDAGTLLVEYWMGEERIAALWVTKSASGVVSHAFSRNDLAIVEGLKQKGSGWRAAAARAGAIVLEGVPWRGPAKNLVIVPDGALSSVPFEMLTEPGAPLLIEQAAVSYLPSAALLPAKTVVPRTAFPWERQLTAFGDPSVDRPAAFGGDIRWSRLPEAGQEIKWIAASIRGAAKIHAGRDDLKRYLLEERPGPLLHFATHAATDTADSNRSRILFTPEQGARGSEYLFRAEVQALPLQGVELATISACETEGGKVVAGEGVQSFSRAFLAAGARSTVTTLWRVDDAATADFMRLFYRYLAHGTSKAEALRAAKLEFLHSGTELAMPQYWAAFVLNGDGGSPIPPIYSWFWFGGPAVAAVMLTVCLRLRARAR